MPVIDKVHVNGGPLLKKAEALGSENIVIIEHYKFITFIAMFLIFNEIFIAYIGLTLSYLQQYILQLSESIYTDENRLKNSRPIIFLFAEKEKVTFSICMLFRRHSSFL